MSRLVGQSVTRVEDVRILSGAGEYVDDLDVGGVLHASFVRSIYPHARLRSIDTDGARVLPGVVAVFTAEDLDGKVGPLAAQGPEGYRSPVFAPLARDRVRYVGDPIVMIVATTKAQSVDACEAVQIDYEPLPAVANAEQATAADAPELFDEVPGNVVHEDRNVYGDPDAAFARADFVIEEMFHQHRQANAPLEGHAGLASYNPSTGDLTYWASHQNPHGLRFGLATSLGLPFHQVHVKCRDVGGAFGQKGYVQREDLVVCVASRQLEQPVKWVADRTENLLAGGQAREETAEIRAAVSSEGLLLGLSVRLVLDQGAYPLTTVPSTVFVASMRVLLPQAYRLEDYSFESQIVATNKASYVAYRGPWEMETWVRERLFDMIARRVGLEPSEVRRRNLLTPDELPRDMVTGPLLDRISVSECLERVTEQVDLGAFRSEQTRLRAAGRFLGIGMATFIEPAPGPSSWGPSIGFVMPDEPARARLDPDGRLTVFTQQQPHGQGHETTFAQVAADTLGVDFEQVRIVYGDTDVTPFSLMGTGGSRAARMATGAITAAVETLRARLAALAAAMFEASEDDIEIAGGAASVRGVPTSSVELSQLAMAAAVMPSSFPPGLETSLDVDGLHDGGEGGWAQAAHCCIVEVDPETGAVDIVRYLAVEDCGRIINPAIVDGQIRGGVTQGLAGVLLERATYDDQGYPRATSFLDYLLPSALEVPTIEITHVETPDLDPLDFRGVGEGGAIVAPAALTNAIADALAPLDVEIVEQYLPPQRVAELCRSFDTGPPG